MAISNFSYYITRELFKENVLTKDSSILEFGEANWYNDIDPGELEKDINTFVTDISARTVLLDDLKTCFAIVAEEERLFGLAKIFYRLFYQSRTIEAVDLHGATARFRHDLNNPFAMDEQVDVTVNNGTAEHVFNVGEVFASMHRATKPGGLMVHEGPLVRGWVDHGFFNFQPTLFFDLARANNYSMLFFAGQSGATIKLTRLNTRKEARDFASSDGFPNNPAFMVFLRKAGTDSEFEVPRQGYYDDEMRDELEEAWRRSR